MTRLSTISTAIAGSAGLPAGVEGTLKKDATVYCVCPRCASVEQTVPESPITLSPSLSLTPFSHSLALLLQPSSKHQSMCWHRRACIPHTSRSLIKAPCIPETAPTTEPCRTS